MTLETLYQILKKSTEDQLFGTGNTSSSVHTEEYNNALYEYFQQATSREDWIHRLEQVRDLETKIVSIILSNLTSTYKSLLNS